MMRAAGLVWAGAGGGDGDSSSGSSCGQTDQRTDRSNRGLVVSQKVVTLEPTDFIGRRRLLGKRKPLARLYMTCIHKIH